MTPTPAAQFLSIITILVHLKLLYYCEVVRLTVRACAGRCSSAAQVGEKASELRRGMIAMKDDATSLILIYGVSISGLALCSYFLFRLRSAAPQHCSRASRFHRSQSMAEFSYFHIVVMSLLRGMNSDAPWQQYYSSNRVTGSGFWFVFNLFGRFVLMRMFLESIAVSQVCARLPLTSVRHDTRSRADSMACCKRNTSCRCGHQPPRCSIPPASSHAP